MLELSHNPLPATAQECLERGWAEVDIVLVSGDAYIDHPSFGIALIGRVLENQGYRVAILPQPRIDGILDFQRFGKPRLFFGISGGNLDSIVSNYSGNGKVRDFDAFSPNGAPWRSSEKTKENRYRPDRAVLIYANLARRAYPGTTIILGGVEASLRRFIHYDYKQNRLRGSQLTDAKADLLIYGMGELSVLEAARHLEHGQNLEQIKGTCIRMNALDILSFKNRMADKGRRIIELPSWEEIQGNIGLFMRAERAIDRQARSYSDITLVQKQQATWVIQFPANTQLESQNLDRFYELPFSRKPHPLTPEIPAFSMIRDSITIVRGCSGNCSFCAISRHQGPRVTSRSVESILSEVQSIAKDDSFNGTITDIGGPTANLFATKCSIGSCKKHDCLFPKVCKNLLIDEALFTTLLDKVLQIEGVNHVHISSGLRMELLMKTPRLMKKLIENHIPGSLKIAPEHSEKEVLTLMHKEPHEQLVRFVETFRVICKNLGIKREVSPYIISAHPGCTEEHTKKMVQKLKILGLTIRQFQDFTPTPGTLSTAMYVSGCNRDKDEPIVVAKNQSERNKQRNLIERAFFPAKRSGNKKPQRPDTRFTGKRKKKS